ncbi:hypothetical protein FRC10_005552, partial [Ceratobasidium sp. 414]
MSAHQVLSATGDVVVRLLRLTAESSDVFPPLKGAATSALHVAEAAQKNFRSNAAQWEMFGTYIQDVTASVVNSLAQMDTAQTEISARVKKLE